MTRPSPSGSRVAIVGGGIVGLSVAHALQSSGEREVVVFEKESTVASHQTGRNSGVIHSGVYYPPESNKAAWVAEGRSALFAFCESEGIPTRRCGKLIVACDVDDLAGLDSLERNARESGIGVERLGSEGITDYEPHVSGLAALRVPSAAVVDYSLVARRLAEKVCVDGEVRLSTRVGSIRPDATGVEVATEHGTERFDGLINCAGLQSDLVAHSAGMDSDAMIAPFRGEYFNLTASSAHLVRGLIYPVPDPRFPFLGVHLTRSVGDVVHVGPNAVPAMAREGYRRRDIELRQAWSWLRDRRLRPLATTYWKQGAAEIRRSLSKRRFLADARRLVPALPDDCLTEPHSGVRAQAVSRTGLSDDFAIERVGSVIHVVNAPSPAATATMAIGRAVAQLYLTA